MPIKKSGKREITEGKERSNQERIRTLGEKGNYKYLEIMEAEIIKQGQMKENLKKNERKP